jgi:hypothetical protein
MNQSEQDLILKNLQTLLKLQAEEIYNLEEDIKKIKKENKLI